MKMGSMPSMETENQGGTS